MESTRECGTVFYDKPDAAARLLAGIRIPSYQRFMRSAPIHSPVEDRLRVFERFPEVERVVLGPFKRKKWMRFRDGYVRIRYVLESGFVVVGYCDQGRQDAIIRCAQENRPMVRDLIEALSCGEIF